MTPTTPESPGAPGANRSEEQSAAKATPTPKVGQTLEKLFELYPHLFGAQFLPLKLGIFHELLTRHPEHFDRVGLKAALGVHTRSTRYLQSIAAQRQRYDLDGAAVESVAPEHVYQALVELFHRRQARSSEDLRPKMRAQLTKAFETSGLTRQEYLGRVVGKDAAINTLLEEALAEHAQLLARQEALRGAFVSSGKAIAEFAQMYGLDAGEVRVALVPHRNPERPGPSEG